MGGQTVVGEGVRAQDSTLVLADDELEERLECAGCRGYGPNGDTIALLSLSSWSGTYLISDGAHN